MWARARPSLAPGLSARLHFHIVSFPYITVYGPLLLKILSISSALRYSSVNSCYLNLPFSLLYQSSVSVSNIRAETYIAIVPGLLRSCITCFSWASVVFGVS